MDNRYGGIPSGPGDFLLAARASVREASYVGGGGSSNCGYWGICWPASVDHRKIYLVSRNPLMFWFISSSLIPKACMGLHARG